MMSITLTLVVLLLVYIAWKQRKKNIVAATHEDWYVVFDIDAEKKILGLWFYPIVAFELLDDATIPIPSKALHAEKARNMRPWKKVHDGRYGNSVSYSCWVRDDAIMNREGHPESDGLFSHSIADYHGAGFKFLYLTNLPTRYAEIVHAIRTRKDDVE